MISAWSHASINKIMAACICKYIWHIPTTSSGRVTTYSISSANSKCSWAIWHTNTVKTMYIGKNGHIALWLTMMQGEQSLTLCWCSLSRRGREHVASSLFYNGGQYIVHDCLQPVALQITQDTLPTIVDAPLTCIFKMGQDGITACFAYKGSQTFTYDCPQPIGSVITQDIGPKIVDAPLMLISMYCVVSICCHR